VKGTIQDSLQYLSCNLFDSLLCLQTGRTFAPPINDSFFHNLIFMHKVF
jgi:hypothetical protein